MYKCFIILLLLLHTSIFAQTENTNILNEVSITGKTKAQIIKESAASVEVVDIKDFKAKSGDLGQILAQAKGVSVQRTGGLGSAMRFSINGLTDDQIRYFYNYVPLDFSAFNFGIANIPIGMLDRVEIYKGIVPASLGADALGGAINVISRKATSGTHGSVSYQTGSFGTHRSEASLSTVNAKTRFFINSGLYFDKAENNYSFYVGIPDEKGRLTEKKVKRFNDAYQGYGAMTEFGISKKKSIDLLSIEIYASSNYKEYQHAQLGVEKINGKSMILGVPYGEVNFRKNTFGSTLRYEQNLGSKLKMFLAGGYNYSENEFLDVSNNFYNWYGDVLFIRKQQGEIENGRPSHQFLWTNSLFEKGILNYQINKTNGLTFQTLGTHVFRTGDELFLGSFDPTGTKSRYQSRVTSLEYTKKDESDRLEINGFVKHYHVAYKSEEPTFNVTELKVEQNSKSSLGFGINTRYRFTENFLIKAAYELATRNPRVDEVLGDGAFISDNLQLKPERGHNTNVELQYNIGSTKTWKMLVNPVFFWREISEHIVFLQTSARNSIYANLFNARSLGSEMSIKVSSPYEKISFAANATYQNYTNTSTDGLFQDQAGDRIPNRPYFFANANITWLVPKISNEKQKITTFGDIRYVGDYYLGWESLGSKNNKQIIPSQMPINAGMSYDRNLNKLHLIVTLEMFNVLDARVYDFFGSQRPGRSMFLKTSINF